MQNQFFWILLLAIMNLFWSLAYTIVKFGLGSIDPLSLIFWRFFIAFIVLLIWVLTKKCSLKLKSSDWIRIAASGALLGFSHWLWVAGINLSYATDASLLYVIEPIWGIVLASIFLKERMRVATIAGLLLAIVGLAALSGFDLEGFGFKKGGVALGNMLLVASLLLEGAYSIIARPLANHISASVITACELLVALFIISAPIIARGSLAVPANLSSILVIAYISLICTVLGYTLWVSVMKHVPVGVMFFTIFIQPVVGPFIAATTLGEKIDSRVIIGGLFLCFGVLIALVGHLRAHKREIIAADDESIVVAGGV